MMKRLLTILLLIFQTVVNAEEFYDFQTSLDLIQGKWIESNTDLATLGKRSAEVKRSFSTTPRKETYFNGWDYNLPDFGKAESPRKKYIPPADRKFDYTYDADARLLKLSVVNEKTKQEEGSLSFNYSTNQCTIHSNTGEFVIYGFSKDKLDYVENSDGKRWDYSYLAHPYERTLLLSEKREKNGAWLKFTYYPTGKIKELFSSYDEGASYLRSCYLEYDAGITSVTDAQGVKHRYHYNAASQIELIETFLPELYRTQEMEWDGTSLIRKTVKNGQGEVLVQQRWAFDERKNLIEEYLEGPLTGNERFESFKRSYRYDEKNRRIEEKEDCGLRVTFEYIDKLPSVKYVWDHNKIVERTFYTYDANGFLSETRVDDNGCASSIERRLSIDLFDHPKEIIKGIIDTASGQEIIQEKTRYIYDEKGRVVREEKEDTWAATIYGEMTEILSSSGTRALISDIEKHFYDSDGEKVFYYTPSGLLLREEIFKNNQLISSISYNYNRFLQVTEKIENGSIVTSYTYDCLGRKIQETSPPILNADNSPYIDVKTYHYDPLNRPQGLYNARGQSLENKFYTLNGYLEKEIYQDGTYYTFRYDSLGRVIEKSFFNELDIKLRSHESIYAGAHLIKEVFSSGISLEHSYDSCGRKISSFCPETGRKIEWEHGNDTIQKEWFSPCEYSLKSMKPEKEKEADNSTIDWVCNNLGQMVIQKKFFQADGSSVTIRCDALHRPEELDTFSISGEHLLKKHLRHDPLGRKIFEKIELIREGRSIVNYWQYDEKGNLIAQIESAGAKEERKTEYTYNSHGKLESETHASGNHLFYQYDISGKLSKFQSKTLDYELFYDEAGRISSVIDQINHLETKRSYNLEGQIISETLANGLKFENTYDLIGRRTSLKLPDGSSIHYRYDKNQLAEITRKNIENNFLYSQTSSEMIMGLGTLTIEKNENGRIKSIHSPYFEQYASYDNYGRLIELATSDLHGNHKNNFRYTTTKLEENSHTYTIDALSNITQIDGTSFSINSLNQLQELEYDLEGNVVKRILDKDLFEFAYDSLNRLTTVKKNGNTIHKYVYDLFHRRLIDYEKCAFLYDGMDEIGRWQDKILELKVDAIAFELNNEIYAPIFNALGSVATLVHAKSKKAVEAYHYTAFGLSEDDSLSPWGYANKRFDAPTGLIHFGRRDYDPVCGRFMTSDPLGFTDGPNRYAYCQSNPLNLKDTYGLQSESFQEESSSSSNFFDLLGEKFLSFFGLLKRNTWLGGRDVFEHMTGGGFLLLSGYNTTETATGSYGNGEVNGKIRVSYINGILTDEFGLFETLKDLSATHGNVNIHYVYRPTKGWVRDILHAFAVELGLVSDQAKMLADMWKMLLQEMGGVDGGGKIIHYAHSIGAIETMRALGLLSVEEQKLIKVYAFGSPSLAEESPSYQIHHYVSIRDGVCLLNLAAFIQACNGSIPNVVFTGTFVGLPFIDHLFRDQAYRDIWKSMGRTFVDWYGSL